MTAKKTDFWKVMNKHANSEYKTKGRHVVELECHRQLPPSEADRAILRVWREPIGYAHRERWKLVHREFFDNYHEAKEIYNNRLSVRYSI